VNHRRGLTALTLALLFAVGCGEPGPEGSGAASSTTPTQATPQVPEPDMTGMESEVQARFRQTRGAVLAKPSSAEAWGRLAMVAHAHELWEEALIAYLQAEKLDPSDERWPYYRGDVQSVMGTDLAASAAAFRRAMELKKDYAPAHMRLGKVLRADGQVAAATAELERALELAPGLQPARVTLAQIRLAEGELERSEEMLAKILKAEPRHAQALSTLGQVYMRQGRRDEARATATRARDAAIYNLFSDPLMSQVVAEGVSAVLIWERAKAFFDNGNYQQAAKGLRQVVLQQPENADAHQQLGVAYGNLGEMKSSRRHLERAVALEGDRVDALVQLVAVQLELQDPGPALGHLKHILELAPNDPDARWMLARAQVLTGDIRGALASFETAAAAPGEVPVWARNEWGSALAQSGRGEEALAQFRAVLAAEPNNAQALFFVGLLHEGMGRIEEAVMQYCRSVKAQPNPPAQVRLSALGRTCG
jgi:protein O-GlcNAc transferase